MQSEMIFCNFIRNIHATFSVERYARVGVDMSFHTSRNLIYGQSFDIIWSRRFENVEDKNENEAKTFQFLAPLFALKLVKAPNTV